MDDVSRKYDKARDLAEDAVGDMANGDEAAAKKKIDEARKIDPKAIEDVNEELNEEPGKEK
jgi:hypothetical protein